MSNTLQNENYSKGSANVTVRQNIKHYSSRVATEFVFSVKTSRRKQTNNASFHS